MTTESKKQPDRRSIPPKLNGFFRRLKRSKPFVAVVRLEGVIMTKSTFKSGISLEGVKENIDKAFKIKPKAVVFQINSPGGSPVQSELIYHYVRNKAEQTKIPVITFAEDVAASGGYWLLTMGDESYAAAHSVVGSIGVISAGFGYVGAIKKLGIERRVYTQGESKNILDPFKPEDKKSVTLLSELQKEVYEGFKAHVKKVRHQKLSGEDDVLFSGAFWTGNTAKKLGLVDSVGEMYTVLQAQYGPKLRVVKIDKSHGFLRRYFSSSAAQIVDQCLDRFESHLYWSAFKHWL